MYSKKIKLVESCYWDDKLGIIVHRFDMGERTCHCAEVTVELKETHGGWRRIPKQSDNSSKEKSSE